MLFNRTNIALALGLTLLVGGGVWFLVPSTVEDIPVDTPTVSKFISLPPAAPRALSIPRLGINVPFGEPLGLLPSGELTAPEFPHTVSYYTHAVTPGEAGPAVIVGYKQLSERPAIFSSLTRLTDGDTVSIERADDIVAHFVVTDIDRSAGTFFPTNAVYDDVPESGIRLLGCIDVAEDALAPCIADVVVFGELIATSAAPMNE